MSRQTYLILDCGPSQWKLSFTRHRHMGLLKSMKYGSLVKALHKFSMVHKTMLFGIERRLKFNITAFWKIGDSPSVCYTQWFDEGKSGVKDNTKKRDPNNRLIQGH